jgi:hypothetical protein
MRPALRKCLNVIDASGEFVEEWCRIATPMRFPIRNRNPWTCGLD